MLQCRKCVSALDNAHYRLCIDTVAAAPRLGTLVYKYADIPTTNTPPLVYILCIDTVAAAPRPGTLVYKYADTNTPPLVLSLSALPASAGAHIHA